MLLVDALALDLDRICHGSKMVLNESCLFRSFSENIGSSNYQEDRVGIHLCVCPKPGPECSMPLQFHQYQQNEQSPITLAQ